MNYTIAKMSEKYTREISKWVYDEPYNIYSGNNSNEYILELLDGSYYIVLGEKEEVFGFYCFGKAAQVSTGNEYGAYDDKSFIDIGLGIKPNLCGRGYGYQFLRDGLQFAQKEFSREKFRLTVASFNTRAIKLYEKIGFRKVLEFERKQIDSSKYFLVLVFEM